MGLVCFRLKGANDLSEKLLKSITSEGLIFMVPAKIGEIFFLRFAICASSTQKNHIDFAWEIVSKNADKLAV
jgi:aromatic-L-amino-acid decarboxylase